MSIGKKIRGKGMLTWIVIDLRHLDTTTALSDIRVNTHNMWWVDANFFFGDVFSKFVPCFPMIIFGPNKVKIWSKKFAFVIELSCGCTALHLRRYSTRLLVHLMKWCLLQHCILVQRSNLTSTYRFMYCISNCSSSMLSSLFHYASFSRFRVLHR